MTPEAMLLSALDDLEAKFQTLRGEFEAGVQAGRPANQMSDWVRSMERPLFDSQRYLAQSGAAPMPVTEQVDRPQASLEEVPSFTLRS